VLPIGPGQSRPLSLYLISVAPSGERKSACDAEAMRPIRRREAALGEQFKFDHQAHVNDRAAYDRARKDAEGNGKGDRVVIRAALDAIGTEPIPPLGPMLTCPEPTYEGMCRLLAVGQPSIGIFAAEGGQFVGGHGMSDEARLRTAAGLSSAWDGEPIRRVRVGDGFVILPGRRLSLHLMLQPEVANIWLRDRLLVGQGLLSRILITAPNTAMGGRLSHVEAPGTAPAMARYGASILGMLERQAPLAGHARNELAPRSLPLSAAAAQMWSRFADRIETMLAPDRELRPISGIANKLAEHAARIGAVLTLVRDVDAAEVAAAEMAGGIELVQHYAAEALRLHGGSLVSADLRLAQMAIDWMLLHWLEAAISLPDLYQRGPAAIRDSHTARRAVAILEEHGWLLRIQEGATIAETRRREAWLIVRG
jgi:hypothetical protein